MRNNTLKGKRIAILATEGFEQSELEKPKEALENAGARVDVIAPEEGIRSGKIRSWDKTGWGDSVDVEVTLSDAEPDDYDMLLLPGGVINADKLRADPDAVNFVMEIAARCKPIAAICHGPWTLIEGDLVRGRMLTSWPSLQTDLRNAGANWVDEEVVEDEGLITSRNPGDILSFNKKIIEVLQADTAEYSKAS
ncbi:MAG TPA: type 1 glutamine amidotransferase domain-containing protein [Acidobacteriaceae bacterium]|jgi:protease I|nr:type 1 glutamine amidotransferase domain-containing protein [Acidobacteriaceae bacterium]